MPHSVYNIQLQRSIITYYFSKLFFALSLSLSVFLPFPTRIIMIIYRCSAIFFFCFIQFPTYRVRKKRTPSRPVRLVRVSLLIPLPVNYDSFSKRIKNESETVHERKVNDLLRISEKERENNKKKARTYLRSTNSA